MTEEQQSLLDLIRSTVTNPHPAEDGPDSHPQSTGLPASRPPAMGQMLLQTDGASAGNPGPAGAGYVIFDAHGREITRGAQHLGRTTNNVAEYRALLLGLTAAKAAGASDLLVRMDSELVVKQMLGQYKVKHVDMQALHRQANEVAEQFSRIRFEYVPREANRVADHLASQAAREGDGETRCEGRGG